MPLYGFKYNNERDRVAITSLLTRQGLASTTTHQTYDTLAQYQIKDVELRPANLGLGRPQRWLLAFNTNLVGMNLPNGQALWFGQENRPSGDSYSTMELNVDQFAKMLKGGLYVDPDGYMKRLRSGLVDQTCYRQTKTALTTMKVSDAEQRINAGDFRFQQRRGREYFVARDLQGYSDVKPGDRTNLFKVVENQVDKIAEKPLTQVAHLQVPEDVHLAQETVTNGFNFDQNLITKQAQRDVQHQSIVNSGVSFALSEQSAMKTEKKPHYDPTAMQVVNNGADVDVVNNTVKRQQRLQQQRQAQAQTQVEDTLTTATTTHDLSDVKQAEQSAQADGVALDDVAVPETMSMERNDQSNGQASGLQHNKLTMDHNGSDQENSATFTDDDNADLDNLLSQMNDQMALPKAHGPRRRHVYVDDFAQAMHNSQNNQNKRRQRVAENQDAKSKDVSDDLSL